MPTTNFLATDIRNLVDQMDTFLTATGASGAAFTQDSAPTGTTTGDAAWNAASAGSNTGELYVQLAWSAQNLFTLHQSLGFSAPNNPGSETGDSNYPSDVDLFGVNLVNAEVWGFANGDADNENDRYAHFVVEFNRDGRFAHFGFGHIEKTFGPFLGGAYKYGWEWEKGGTGAQVPWSPSSRLLLDSNHTAVATAQNLATITARSLTNQSSNGDYLVFTNSDSNPASNDANGNGIDRADGFARMGPWQQALLHIRGNPNNAFLPLVPVRVNYRANTEDTIRRPLGQMKDVRVCNIGNIQPKQTIVLGSDTWQFFPWAQKITGPGSGLIGSRNAGVAYKVV